MILALLLAQAVAVAPPLPPDWSTLPQLRFVAPPRPHYKLSMFVRREVVAGRCAAAQQGTEGWTLKVELAVLVDARGRARRAVPRAIDCPTVEQFAAGVLSRVVRDNLYPTGTPGEAWQKTALTFTWDR